ILVGAESTYQKIKNRPALDSRILVWQRYKPLTPSEILTVIPQYHPLWAAAPTDDLLWIDDLACHGNFRQWAKLTYLITEAQGALGPGAGVSPQGAGPSAGTAAPTPHPAYSRDLVRAVLSRLDPTQRHAD
ncbi:ATP-binding protein, partial [Streptomyces chartreusis]